MARGRPQRLAHLVAGSDRARRRERAIEAISNSASADTLSRETAAPKVDVDASSAGAGLGRAAILCLPQPDWLLHTLTVVGPPDDLATFRAAAAGSGRIPWLSVYDRQEEDWLYQLLAPPSAERGISVHGARIVARQLRELTETLDGRAADRGEADCPLDLHSLVPVPEKLRRLGPDDAAVLAWLWENWGTTRALRDVEVTPSGLADSQIPDGHKAACFRFWSADWTPWRAIAAAQSRWKMLSWQVRIQLTAE